MNSQSLRAREKAIAEQFMGGIPWLMVFWGITNTAIWIALWPLVFTGIMPLWLGFIIATINITASYLPSHDAQHYIIAPKGSKLEWFNELVGHWSLIPLTLPLRTARITHMEHHKQPVRCRHYGKPSSTANPAPKGALTAMASCCSNGTVQPRSPL